MGSLELLFNHLVLPPKVPGTQDPDTIEVGYDILARLIRTCRTLSKYTVPEFAETWTSIEHSLRLCQNLNSSHLEKKSMLRQFSQIELDDFLILHVVEQNAALLIRCQPRNGVHFVVFEAFEASPSCEAVLSTENALEWEFPGRAAEISMDEFLDPYFQESLTTFLEQASAEPLSRFEARSTKASASVIETRDTVDPALVTQLLIPLLEAIGSPIDVPRLKKRIRDNVNIQSSEFPWRRLPFWLILRVALQRQLCLKLGNSKGRVFYKFLICTVLAQFLEDCAGQMAIEQTILLRAKVCRRLAKLVMDKDLAGTTSGLHMQLFTSVEPLITQIIEKTTLQIDLAWENYKRSIVRRIPKLPSRADPSSLTLSLPNSGDYLKKLINLPRFGQKKSSPSHFLPMRDTTVEQAGRFASRYFKLLRLETQIEKDLTPTPTTVVLCESRCVMLAESIANLFLEVGSAYDSNPEQLSAFILNLFDIWVKMDKCAVKACPLLSEYHPIFTPQLLDVLHLPKLSDMDRLQCIQIYLLERCKSCYYPDSTIFKEPERNCFAVEYLKNSSPLIQLQQKIEDASNRSRERKKFELETESSKYDELTRKIADGTCVCSVDPDGTRNVKGCTKCWHKRTRKRMAISIHEDFLPQEFPQKAAVLFELGIPSYIAAYRNATWRILSNLAHPSKPKDFPQPAMLLKDYPQLSRFNSSIMDGISLASAKKSFLQTHFGKMKMKVSLSQICLPLGLWLSYYDTRSGVWLKDFDKPLTFQHLCGIHVPRSLQNSVIQPLIHPAPIVDGPTSYEIIASKTKCPPNMSVHEFMAYQRLLSGKNRRWMTMLVELGASNINFSNEDTMHIFSHLTVQAGPAGNGNDALRAIHQVFWDGSFCLRLIEQIDNRLRAISTNWRETYTMEMLITISLRVFELTSGSIQHSSEELLLNARKSTLQWIHRLRIEFRNATEAATAETAARYGFWAALLCRRTFTTFIGLDHEMKKDDLCSFVQASLALQENLVVDLENLSLNLRNMLIRDMKMAYQLEPLLKRSIQSNPQALGEALNSAWSDPFNYAGRTYSPWQFLPSPDEMWVQSNMDRPAGIYKIAQVLHYNFLEGHLFVDGEPLKKLPREIRESEDVKELFGSQHLQTYSSSLQGMSHVMATQVGGYDIHFGLRGNSVVIQALSKSSYLEYVPRRVFTDSDSFDLPLDLTENCVHWLNIQSKCLEIRHKSSIWKPRMRDWKLDILNCIATRKNSCLVDPNSKLYKQVSRAFYGFEAPHRLTVFQHESRPLSVELRHLELTFKVNKKSLLQCRELQAEIDPNQDAGTLYGLESKIVLREPNNPERRSIIVAIGPLVCKRQGMHVAVKAQGTNEYGKFEIDDVLGRLTCAPEPVILFAKAQFHAFTSFPLPDPLTRRTGVEESLQMLRSGYCQPWTPLGEMAKSLLMTIKDLSPQREYYPKDKRKLQTTTWDPNLTMNIQHDSYETLVENILTKSNKLQAFSPNSAESPIVGTEKPSHLRRRGELDRFLYERGSSDSERHIPRRDVVYVPRDRHSSLPQSTKVFQIVQLLRKQPFSIHMKKKLAHIIEEWKLIGGFHATPEKSQNSLNDLIEKSTSEQWGNLMDYSRQTKPWDLYRLMFRFGLLAFGASIDMDLINSLVAIARLDELKAIEVPLSTSFVDFKSHELPTLEFYLKFTSTEYSKFEPPPRMKKNTQRLAQEQHQVECENESQRFAQHLFEQWSNPNPSVEDFESSKIDVGKVLTKILPELNRLHKNMNLSEYIDKVQVVLNRYMGAKDKMTPRTWNSRLVGFYSPKRGHVIPSLCEDLVLKHGPPAVDTLPNLSTMSLSTQNKVCSGASLSRENLELEKILESLVSANDSLRQEYGNDLKKSLKALENYSNQESFHGTLPSTTAIKESIQRTRDIIANLYANIKIALSVDDDRFQWLKLGNLWPSITPSSILKQIRSSSSKTFGENMKETIVSYGVQITALQRLLRLQDALLKGDRHKLLDAWNNPGHENWNPSDFPDWLLLEIDSDLLIRSEQIDVAHAIMSPSSGTNSVLQMNMGKGKTSCIMPMAAVALANKKQLIRLIVPKALLLQTAQTMQLRLGGLLGREIRHISFSRRTPTTPDMLELYSALHREIASSSGVILTSPEHILSYKLSGLQHLADSKLKEARNMVDFQSWLATTSRDILDESDFALAVKTQLIYPSGPQLTLDGHPFRWEVAQKLLCLVEDHLPDLQREYPDSIEVFERPQGFPMVHFLQADVEEALHCRIIDDICNGKASFLRLIDNSSPATMVRAILTEENIKLKSVKRVSQLFSDSSSAYKKILLVRGLLLKNILLLCLKKRWNVQYGLHPRRHPIAVPFEAKGVPSEQAEFGYPDVAILLTCLSFYFSGLSLPQFGEGLRLVLRSDNPSAAYERWIDGSDTLPNALHHWNIINVDDQGQLYELWYHLKLTRNVLDHYMNNFVFPVHAKQFGVKLQASGWDLPLFSQSSAKGKEISWTGTTGFSGTNDNKMMLPLTIKQDDLPSLSQTNAEVLTYLLKPRNRLYIPAVKNNVRLSEADLLQTISRRKIRILIDAGAYILEMDNSSLAKKWLEIDKQAKGAVYFRDDNRAWVQYRGGKQGIPLLATPFAKNLEGCLVYLDEAHTRGVDLKLPQDACGALTLALGQTKDHTVQAAMRLRQLGSTQSIVFFAPPEVHKSIVDVCQLNANQSINSSHVIQWLLEQTCCANEQLQNLYLAQGTDFCRRTNAQWDNANFLTDGKQRESFLNIIQHPERQSLEQLYGGTQDYEPCSHMDLSSKELRDFMVELNKRRQLANQNGNLILSSALEEVEQEREVEIQVEEERQVQKQVHFKALNFQGLHPSILGFARTGNLNTHNGFEHAFTALGRTSIGKKYNVTHTESRLFLSSEFLRTVVTTSGPLNENFLRPVEWILWSPPSETALIITSEEVELLIPLLWDAEQSMVHLLAYSAPVTKSMSHFNGLSYYALPPLPIPYSIPPWLPIELGIFGGRLYFDFSEYDHILKYLQINENLEGLMNHNKQAVTFASRPINFLLEWLTLCRNGQDIMHTPMGYICQGRVCLETHSFFTACNVYAEGVVVPTVRAVADGAAEEEDDGDSDQEDQWDPDA
ncbi:MAG: hypothetical protein M1829_005414 [Trizodia sp. TS-e1964]|nr:MAG: hypothetical protein M1829_005414 [Trizodia sp. TS-e1964]